MYPVSDNEWLGIKSEPVDDAPAVGNVSRSWQWRERGTDPPNYPPNKKVFENIAEDILVQKPLQIRSCDLPGYPRSTFLMVFSPDGTKVASTHGNHNVYVSELASGKHVRILKGHPRTPWCIAFHPSHPQLIGSGCLGGQVRVWDIASGGSEVWNVRNETVIASIAFHPREQLLVIATYNELYFWDWSHPAPFTKVSTNNVNEKVRYVAFDSLGYKLITGISLWACPGSGNSNTLPTPNTGGSNYGSGGSGGSGGNGNGGTGNSGSGGNGAGEGSGGADDRGDGDPPNGPPRPTDNPAEAQDMIVSSYQTLVQRYDSLVRNYQRLFMVRHRLINTPPPPNTIDRGTDPMETYNPMDIGRRRRVARRYSRPSSSNNDNNSNPSPSTSGTRRQEGTDSGDGESSSSRFLNLDILSLDSDASRTEDSPTQERSPFGSRSSAFQPLNESSRTFRTVEQRGRTRLLPNPFSSRSAPAPRSRRHLLERADSSADLHSSRTSILFAPRSSVALTRDLNSLRDFVFRRRNRPPSPPRPDRPEATAASPPAPAADAPHTPPPTTANSSTQMSPDADDVDAQTINESLDLIRDILRDSGTRLLNLITNMSMNLMSERGAEGAAGAARRRSRVRRLFSGDLRRDFLASSSDSDGDHADILRTLNSAFSDETPPHSPPRASDTARTDTARPDNTLTDTGRTDASRTDTTRTDTARTDTTHTDTTRTDTTSTETTRTDPARTDRMVFDLEIEALLNERFRVRTQNGDSSETNDAAAESQPPPADFDPNVPSTSRDDFWSRGTQNISSMEAYRRVKLGVHALQKHTLDLGQMWLRGERLTMSQLRNMWENLRRRILGMQRELGRDGSPGYYTRSLLERCMLLSEMTELASRPRLHATRRANLDASTSTANSGGAAATDAPSSGAGTRSESRPRASRAAGARATPLLRRRLHSNYRYRPRTNHARRDFARAFEINATRHEIRMRAMQVLSVMFNMMMRCLEERGLSQTIMHMLKSLKKALALSCFMMMSNRTAPRPSSNPAPQTANVESMDVVRIQNAEHAGPVNVDGPDDPASPRVNVPADDPPADVAVESPAPETGSTKSDTPSTSQSAVTERDTQTSDTPSPPLLAHSQRWSRRLAVQIAAANRNTSTTARRRRDLYMESKRQKALHRTNPGAHPLVKRRFPPVSAHRIPALRSLPRRGAGSGITPRVPPPNDDLPPVPTPSRSNASSSENPNADSPRGEMNDFDSRVNLIRIAHLQAVRLRNAARHRFRRLQTIRFYTPSSVFALHPNNAEVPPESDAAPAAGGEPGRRPLASPAGGARDPPHFHAVLNNVAMPLMQVNDLAPAPDSQPANRTQRVPRIHEYLQPIILAQNAMVVEEEGEGGGGARRMGGMAGLLDAGIISEALPAPSNRVQAWDFTGGRTPDIADNTKNVVVQRCRIHNDASIDISKDGRLLVALLPVTRLRNTNSWLGVYSLEWDRLGQCLHTAVLEQSAVSVALSPTARYLAVGLGSRRFSSAPHSRPTNVIALLYKLDPRESSSRTGLSPIKELMQQWEHGFTSLNCLRWAPQPGQGLVYANNTGQLIIMS